MNKSKFLQKLSVFFGTLLVVATVSANEWQLNSDASQLSFISVKKTHIAELHQFKQLKGFLDEQGEFSLTIDLASVDTNIAVRDERMKLHLFDVAKFASANISAKIDMESIEAIALGASKQLEINATLALHGQIQDLTLSVMVTRLVGAKLSVVSMQPIILNVGDFALVAGIDKLREIAKLPSISHAVPVSFYLTFNHI